MGSARVWTQWWVIAGAIIALDQLTKSLADAYLIMHHPVQVLPGMDLTLTYNTGAAFSFLSQAGGWQRWALAVLSLVVSGLIIFWLRRLPAARRWETWAFALILGGALGNAIDRIGLGHVRDFIDLHYGAWHWPAFNVADSAISVGAVMLVIDAVRQHRLSAAAGRPPASGGSEKP